MRHISILTFTCAFGLAVFAPPVFSQDKAQGCAAYAELLDLEKTYDGLFIGLSEATDIEPILNCFIMAPRAKNRNLVISLELPSDSPTQDQKERTTKIESFVEASNTQTVIRYHEGGVGPYTHGQRVEMMAEWGTIGHLVLASAREDSIARSINRQLEEDTFLIAINDYQHVARHEDKKITSAGAQIRSTVATVDIGKTGQTMLLSQHSPDHAFDYTYTALKD